MKGVESKNRFLNKKELAEYLGLSRFSIDSWVSQRTIPFIKMGRRVLFDLRNIEDWVGRNKIIPVDRNDLPK